MIIDITGIELTPGYGGEYCKGNGEHFDEQGEPIECCCDECNYLLSLLLQSEYRYKYNSL